MHIFQNYLFICYLCFFLSNTSFGLHGSDTNISFCFLWEDTALCLDGCKNLFYLISPSSWIIEAYSKNLSNSRVDCLKIVGHLVQQFFFYYFAMISIFACFVYTSQANHSQISTWILLQNSTYLGYHTYLAVLLNLNCAPFRCKSGRADSTVSTRVSWLAKPRSTWFSSVIH